MNAIHNPKAILAAFMLLGITHFPMGEEATIEVSIQMYHQH